MFETVAELLAQASATRPVIFVCDDLHWADKPTLLMLRHILRASGAASLCVVATYRQTELARTHPLVELLADFRNEPSVTRVSLRGLDEVHLQDLIDAIVGSGTRPELARVVMDNTDGNPFFVVEMLRHLSETGALADLRHGRRGVKGALGLPEGVKEVIGRRLSRLSEEANRTLSLAAVIGREFGIEILEAIGDLPESRLLDAIDEAVQAQLIAELPDGVGRFAFLHALIRETVYGELTTTRRVRVHRRVGEAIERLASGRPDPPLADLAYHFVQAVSMDTADKAINYATRAGDGAAGVLAQEEAARFYDMALQSLEFKSPGPEVEALRCELHAQRGSAFGALAQWALQKTEMERALEHLDPLSLERRCELLEKLVGALFFSLDIQAVERLAPELLALAEQVQRSDLAANAIAWLARARSAAGDLRGSIEMDSRAISRAGGARTFAHAMQPLSLYLTSRTTEGIALGLQAAEMARTSHDTSFTMNTLSHLALNLGSAGRYAEAAKAFDEVRRFGHKYGVLPLLARATSMSVGFHLNLFDFSEAESLALEARDLGRSAGFAPSVVSAGIDLLLIFARRRTLSTATRLLEETAAAVATTPGWHEWLWRLRLCQVRAELALAGATYDTAVMEASEGIRQSQASERPKYEALGLMTRARALHGVGRTYDAVVDAREGVRVARRTADPALLLLALDALLALDGDDASAAEARALDAQISSALPDQRMQQRFSESEVAQRVRRICN